MNALEERCDAIAHAAYAPEVPPTLWHYTRWEGLAGILSSRKLWAVDYRAQKTDEHEFRHADEAIAGLARELYDGARSEWHRARFAEWLDTLQRDPFRKAAESLFITSFCERGDSQHMWNSFGCDGAGFALELRIMREEYNLPQFGLLTMRVDYDESSVLERLRSVVLEILDTSRRMRVRDRARADWLTDRQLWFAGARAAIQCKAAHFATDEEWRRVVMPRNASEQVLQGPRRVEVPVRDGDRHPSVRTIHIGPNANADAAQRIYALLREQGYVDAMMPCILRVRP